MSHFSVYFLSDTSGAWYGTVPTRLTMCSPATKRVARLKSANFQQWPQRFLQASRCGVPSSQTRAQWIVKAQSPYIYHCVTVFKLEDLCFASWTMICCDPDKKKETLLVIVYIIIYCFEKNKYVHKWEQKASGCLSLYFGVCLSELVESRRTCF